ncbi:hypothetical protein E4T38_08970 [Aureobasidium subglaciale]|nr:hypothetical protein E4T38_08970 [Aureobasidium subglaciale]KAI5214629.1 hypothetical protein E4T40_08884 [Aureobasidium subglaciale]KAI5217395.1 hypothetical protein E4T41_08843 [Aureobasidium subglaciale]KAI5255054.1 hypothetical protein E4T46_08877 [Aureobasidium subglaciale]
MVYLTAFYQGFEVAELPSYTLTFDKWGERDTDQQIKTCVALNTPEESIRIRKRPISNKVHLSQLNLNDLLDVAIAVLPSDALALILLMGFDLYEDDDDEFACGRAYGGSHVCVVSSFRYNPYLDKELGIDRSHIWPASHCARYVNAEVDKYIEKESTYGKRKRESAIDSSTTTLGSPLAQAVAACGPQSFPSLWLERVCRTASHEIGHCLGIDHFDDAKLNALIAARGDREKASTAMREDALIEYTQQYQSSGATYFIAFQAWLIARKEMREEVMRKSRIQINSQGGVDGSHPKLDHWRSLEGFLTSARLTPSIPIEGNIQRQFPLGSIINNRLSGFEQTIDEALSRYYRISESVKMTTCGYLLWKALLAVALLSALYSICSPWRLALDLGCTQGEMLDDYRNIPPSSKLEWYPCFEDFLCAKFRVSMNHNRSMALSDGEGAVVDIALIMVGYQEYVLHEDRSLTFQCKLPGRDHVKHNNYSISPLIVNPGGPGASGVEFVRQLGWAIRNITGDDQDIVGFDPRGTGYTKPTADCYTFSPSDLPVTDAEILRGEYNRVQFIIANEELGLVNSSQGALRQRDEANRAVAELCKMKDEIEGDGSILRYLDAQSVARDLLAVVDAWGRWRDTLFTKQDELEVEGSTKGQLVYLGYSYGMSKEHIRMLYSADF